MLSRIVGPAPTETESHDTHVFPDPGSWVVSSSSDPVGEEGGTVGGDPDGGSVGPFVQERSQSVQSNTTNPSNRLQHCVYDNYYEDSPTTGCTGGCRKSVCYVRRVA